MLIPDNRIATSSSETIQKIRDIIELPEGSKVLNAIGWCLLSIMIGILGAVVGILLARNFYAY